MLIPPTSSSSSSTSDLLQTQNSIVQNKVLAQHKRFDTELSSLNSKKKSSYFSSIFSCFIWPLVFLGKIFAGIGGFLQSHVLCCCYCPPPADKMDWAKTKEIFDEIYTAVIVSHDHVTDRARRFDHYLKKLDAVAQGRFREHIGFVLAERQTPPILERVEQEKWFKENREGIAFHKDYFKNVGRSEVLDAAIVNFHSELEKK